MLQTPFEKINILIDGIATDFEAEPFDYINENVDVSGSLTR